MYYKYSPTPAKISVAKINMLKSYVRFHFLTPAGLRGVSSMPYQRCLAKYSCTSISKRPPIKRPVIKVLK